MKDTLVYVGTFLGKCVRKSKSLGNASAIALASVAQSLLSWRNVLVEDLSRIKEAKLQSIEAKTAAEQAETQKKLAAAADASNKVTEREHDKAMRELELQEKAIRNRKLKADAAAAQAKADKTKADAAKHAIKAYQSLMEVYDEARRRKIEAAEQELLNALRQYNAEGGKLYIDSENLKSLLKLKDSPPEPPKD